MKKYIALSIVLISLSFCTKKKEEDITISIPCCVQDILAVNDTLLPILKVKTQEVDGVFHYWLQDDARTFDGAELVVNDQCDTICTIGGRFTNTCSKQYDAEKWVVIWTK